MWRSYGVFGLPRLIPVHTNSYRIADFENEIPSDPVFFPWFCRLAHCKRACLIYLHYISVRDPQYIIIRTIRNPRAHSVWRSAVNPKKEMTGPGRTIRCEHALRAKSLNQHHLSGGKSTLIYIITLTCREEELNRCVRKPQQIRIRNEKETFVVADRVHEVVVGQFSASETICAISEYVS